ncbi:MAG TPA: hypothetical protein VFO86_14450 [Terriglobia bacterium]|nr:hypothetical protein [Terriglobia bacterium]
MKRREVVRNAKGGAHVARYVCVVVVADGPMGGESGETSAGLREGGDHVSGIKSARQGYDDISLDGRQRLLERLMDAIDRWFIKRFFWLFVDICRE